MECGPGGPPPLFIPHLLFPPFLRFSSVGSTLSRFLVFRPLEIAKMRTRAGQHRPFFGTSPIPTFLMREVFRYSKSGYRSIRQVCRIVDSRFPELWYISLLNFPLFEPLLTDGGQTTGPSLCISHRLFHCSHPADRGNRRTETHPSPPSLFCLPFFVSLSHGLESPPSLLETYRGVSVYASSPRNGVFPYLLLPLKVKCIPQEIFS